MATRAGYAGGTLAHPSYHLVGDHLEAVEVLYDPRRLSYEDLLATFWAAHPTAGAPAPSRVREAVLYRDDEQQAVALASRRAIARRSGERVSTAVLAQGTFWPAEAMHQKFHLQRQAPGLVDELAARYGGREGFLASTVAARLNAFAGGFRGEQTLAAAARELGMDPGELRRRLARASSPPPTPR